MQLFFTSIPYAVTSEGEIVDINHTGNDRLVCEFCGVGLWCRTDGEGRKVFEHTLMNQSDIANASRCLYWHMLTGDWQPYHRLAHSMLSRHILQHPTLKRTWHCRSCGYRYEGRKSCPHCADWVSTVEA